MVASIPQIQSLNLSINCNSDLLVLPQLVPVFN